MQIVVGVHNRSKWMKEFWRVKWDSRWVSISWKAISGYMWNIQCVHRIIWFLAHFLSCNYSGRCCTCICYRFQLLIVFCCSVCWFHCLTPLLSDATWSMSWSHFMVVYISQGSKWGLLESDRFRFGGWWVNVWMKELVNICGINKDRHLLICWHLTQHCERCRCLRWISA